MVVLLVVQVVGLDKKRDRRLDCTVSLALHNMLLILQYYTELLPPCCVYARSISPLQAT